MSNHFKKKWEIYVSSWKEESASNQQALFEKCLDTSCEYNDPLAKTKGWNELTEYIQSFQKQIPGGHIITTYFLAHNNKSIAKWEMKNRENTVIGDGISYGEYNEKGNLISITGFFETP